MKLSKPENTAFPSPVQEFAGIWKGTKLLFLFVCSFVCLNMERQFMPVLYLMYGSNTPVNLWKAEEYHIWECELWKQTTSSSVLS